MARRISGITELPSGGKPTDSDPKTEKVNLKLKQDIVLLPLSPLPAHLSPFLQLDSPLAPEEKKELFNTQFLRCALAGNSDTLEWLLEVPPNPLHPNRRRSRPISRASFSSVGSGLSEELPETCPRRWIDIETRDEDGNSALSISVALGNAECVRVLVESDVNINSRDQVGWTPLHWAAQNNDVPIAAYLLNHGAIPSMKSYKGLGPLDLVRQGREGQAMREILRSSTELFLEQEAAESGSCGDKDDRPTSRASSVADSIASISEARAREKEHAERLDLANCTAKDLDLDIKVLGVEENLESKSSLDGDDEDETVMPFDWTRCLPDQMLVFSMDDLGIMFDVIITNMKPVREKKYRSTPANVVFLCARFAHHYATPELLEELILSSIERVEAAVHNRPHDMTNCAFWLSNSLLLLYYFKKEPNLQESTAEFQLHLSDLINEIFVFIIRDAERRIDKILEGAILEHEALPGFEDVQFEGEWSGSRFVKKLTGRGKKPMNKQASLQSLFVDPALASPSSPKSKRKTPPSPKTITSLLSSTLFVLQLYEIPPAIIVQAFSQLFYWIACELFNRLLNQKRYICRSRALQIRMNASLLEDWARINQLPTKLVSVHFAPLNQMLQWLQCLSSESTIDGLIGTVQRLSALNPPQLRRAVRDYRYEVDETKISEDCEQYLLQIHKQWERSRQRDDDHLSITSPASVRSISPSPSNASEVSERGDAAKLIDAAFEDPTSYGSYTPPGGQESFTELLNSRYMLPFALPSHPNLLVNLSATEVFGPFSGLSASTSTQKVPLHSRDTTVTANSSTSPQKKTSSSERLSMSLSVDELDPEPPLVSSPMDTEDFRCEEIVPRLPDEFFTVWDKAKAQVSARGIKQLTQSAAEIEDGTRKLSSDMSSDAEVNPSIWDWRKNMPGEDTEDTDEECSVSRSQTDSLDLIGSLRLKSIEEKKEMIRQKRMTLPDALV